MKKLMLCLVVILFAGVAQAQGTFKIGVMAGIPLSDASDVSTSVLGADAYYFFGKRNALLTLGPTVGFRNYFGDEISPGIEVEDAQFAPISLAARASIFGIIRGGLDVGYAIGISDFLDGGLFVRPQLAFGILRFFELNFSYEYISDNANWSNVNVGLMLVL